MSQRNISLPMTVILICVILISSLLVTPKKSPQAAPVLGNGTQTAYAAYEIQTSEAQAATQTATAAYPLTATAKKTNESTTDTPTNTPTHTPTHTSITTNQADQTPTDTPTDTPTNSPTSTTAPAPTPEENTPTPTPTEDPEGVTIDCLPEQTIVITGTNAPPMTAMVLYMGRDNLVEDWKQKYLPIGGVVSDVDGKYTMSVRMGKEIEHRIRDRRLGVELETTIFDMQLRTRDRMDLVKRFKCRVGERLPRADLDEF